MTDYERFGDYQPSERNTFGTAITFLCIGLGVGSLVALLLAPQSGRKTLYLASHAGRIFGMPEADGRALIDELVAHATQRQFVYTHRWRVHDLVIWDNRSTMHRGTEFDDLRWKRDMQRATICDVANSCEQAGVKIEAA